MARRFIKRNQTVKYLSGIQVVITPEEETALSDRKKDFSIVVSSRNRMTSLFMGPARFANHDCGANAKLVITGQAGIDIVAVRNIHVGEEITVTYGENYFGEDNCECLCRTCEDHLVNGWKQPDGFVPVKKSIEDDLMAIEGYNTRGRRRYGGGESRSRTPSVTPDVRPKVLRTKAKRLRDSDRASTADSSFFEGPTNALKRKRDTESLATPPVTPAKQQKTTRYEVVPSPLHKERSTSSDAESGHITSRSQSSTGEAVLTDVTTPDDTTDHADALAQTMATSQAIGNFKQEQDHDESASTGLQEVAPFPGTADMPQYPPPLLETPRPRERLGLSIRDLINTPSVTSSPIAKTPTDRFAAAFGAQSTMPELDTSEAQEPCILGLSTAVHESEHEDETMNDTDSIHSISARRGPGRPRKSFTSEISANEEVAETCTSDIDLNRLPTPPTGPSTHREPGDYVLTPRLLSEPDMAWVRCTNCSTAFVQQNAYYTRASCPRCERHSKLYGYVWPKTEPDGPRDKEERILDHRVIHRFLALGDELLARGRAPLKGSQTSTPRREESGPSTKRGRTRLLEHEDKDGNEDRRSSYGSESEVRRSGRMRKASFKMVGDT